MTEEEVLDDLWKDLVMLCHKYRYRITPGGFCCAMTAHISSLMFAHLDDQVPENRIGEYMQELHKMVDIGEKIAREHEND